MKQAIWLILLLGLVFVASADNITDLAENVSNASTDVLVNETKGEDKQDYSRPITIGIAILVVIVVLILIWKLVKFAVKLGLLIALILLVVWLIRNLLL